MDVIKYSIICYVLLGSASGFMSVLLYSLSCFLFFYPFCVGEGGIWYSGCNAESIHYDQSRIRATRTLFLLSGVQLVTLYT